MERFQPEPHTSSARGHGKGGANNIIRNQGLRIQMYGLQPWPFYGRHKRRLIIMYVLVLNGVLQNICNINVSWTREYRRCRDHKLTSTGIGHVPIGARRNGQLISDTRCCDQPYCERVRRSEEGDLRLWATMFTNI